MQQRPVDGDVVERGRRPIRQEEAERALGVGAPELVDGLAHVLLPRGEVARAVVHQHAVPLDRLRLPQLRLEHRPASPLGDNPVARLRVRVADEAVEEAAVARARPEAAAHAVGHAPDHLLHETLERVAAGSKATVPELRPRVHRRRIRSRRGRGVGVGDVDWEGGLRPQIHSLHTRGGERATRGLSTVLASRAPGGASERGAEKGDPRLAVVQHTPRLKTYRKRGRPKKTSARLAWSFGTPQHTCMILARCAPHTQRGWCRG